MSTSSRPLPHLPLETQAAILRFCDPSTLAVSSRVSLTWLELAGPLLYQDIKCRGKSGIETLVARKTTFAGIAPFLTFAHVRSYTYIPLRTDGAHIGVPPRVSAKPICVDTLVIDLQADDFPEVDVAIDLSPLLASCDPIHFQFLASSKPYHRIKAFLRHAICLHWTRLQKMTFTNTLSRGPLVLSPALVAQKAAIDLVYDLCADDQGSLALLDSLFELRDVLSAGGPEDLPNAGKGHVQVWVGNEKEVEQAERTLIGWKAESLTIGVKP